MEILKATLILVAALGLLIAFSHWVIARDHAREKLSRCIEDSAAAEQYRSPSSKEAWDLFYAQCNK